MYGPFFIAHFKKKTPYCKIMSDLRSKAISEIV